MHEGHYHFTTKLISRSQGRAICAAAAYRSGEKIRDEHYNKTFDYTPRTSIHAAEIRAPDHAPDWMKNRSQLWNGVEEFETRKNSRLAREFEMSVPVELSPEQRKEAVRQFVDSELVSRGMVADIAFHDFTGRHSHNPHAHILVTTRQIEGGTFSKKKTREWDKEETLLHWREAWAKHANHALAQAQSQTRIDHRSHKDRGLTRTPVNETQQEWHQRQKDIATTQAQLDEVNREIATLEQEQEQERQRRIDALIQFGNDLAQRRATREAERVEQEKKQQKSEQIPAPYSHAPPPEPSPGTDEKALIKWLLDQQADRERHKPRAKGQEPDQATRPAPGQAPEQQTAKLKESIAAFQAEVEKLEQAQHQQQNKTRRTPDQHPREQPDPQQEKWHERGMER